MDYKKVKVPFLGNVSIKKAADAFRSKYWNGIIPLEIEDIIAFELKIDIIPLPNLMKLCNGDAFITSNWNCIYVDNEKYLDERYKNRLRFSFAHEIGHFILHKALYQTFGVKELADFIKFIEEIPLQQYGYLETQAQKFASHLLVLRDKLTSKKIEIIESLKKQNEDLSKVDSNIINSYLAVPLSGYFGVSEGVIEIALNDIQD